MSCHDERGPLPHRDEDADRPGRTRRLRLMPRVAGPAGTFRGGAPASNQSPGHEQRMALYTERAARRLPLFGGRR